MQHDYCIQILDWKKIMHALFKSDLCFCYLKGSNYNFLELFGPGKGDRERKISIRKTTEVTVLQNLFLVEKCVHNDIQSTSVPVVCSIKRKRSWLRRKRRIFSGHESSFVKSHILPIFIWVPICSICTCLQIK